MYRKNMKEKCQRHKGAEGMLQIYNSIKDFNFGQLAEVYTESLLRDGKLQYPKLDKNMQLLEARQDFYNFLKMFFQAPDAKYMVWVHQGRYVSALRVEPYSDGVLIEGLETAPESRRKGFAKALLSHTIEYLKDQGILKIYSHIEKSNLVSVQTHMGCGFVKKLDYAVCIDGSVLQSTDTYCIKL